MAERSSHYRLIEAKLGEPFEGFIAARRPSTSWRAIAADITARTGVEVGGEILRRWFIDRITYEVKVDAGLTAETPASAA
jgi:hypothetical protein